MPQITVEVSSGLDHVDWRGFALELHPVVVETAAAQLQACKTRVLRTEADVVGAVAADGDGGPAIVNLTIALLAGGDVRRARAIGDGYLAVQEPDGRLRQAYFVAPAVPVPAAQDFNLTGTSVGDMAWSGLALAQLALTAGGVVMTA